MSSSPDPTTAPSMTAEEASLDATLDKLAEDLDGLSNLQRLRLLHFLTRPRYAEEIAEHLGMSRQSALKHIEKLEERQFVRAVHGRRASGPVIEYLVNPSRLFAVGVALGNLGRLEPEGGPAVRFSQKTEVLNDDGQPKPQLDAEPRPAQLLVTSGPSAGVKYGLAADKRRWTMGRDEDRDLRLANDPFVSGRHAEIQTERTGPVLVDVFSANGTYLNFMRLPRGGRVPLRPGDVIGIGHTVLVYQKE